MAEAHAATLARLPSDDDSLTQHLAVATSIADGSVPFPNRWVFLLRWCVHLIVQKPAGHRLRPLCLDHRLWHAFASWARQSPDSVVSPDVVHVDLLAAADLALQHACNAAPDAADTSALVSGVVAVLQLLHQHEAELVFTPSYEVMCRLAVAAQAVRQTSLLRHQLTWLLSHPHDNARKRFATVLSVLAHPLLQHRLPPLTDQVLAQALFAPDQLAGWTACLAGVTNAPSDQRAAKRRRKSAAGNSTDSARGGGGGSGSYHAELFVVLQRVSTAIDPDAVAALFDAGIAALEEYTAATQSAVRASHPPRSRKRTAASERDNDGAGGSACFALLHRFLTAAGDRENLVAALLRVAERRRVYQPSEDLAGKQAAVFAALVRPSWLDAAAVLTRVHPDVVEQRLSELYASMWRDAVPSAASVALQCQLLDTFSRMRKLGDLLAVQLPCMASSEAKGASASLAHPAVQARMKHALVSLPPGQVADLWDQLTVSACDLIVPGYSDHAFADDSAASSHLPLLAYSRVVSAALLWGVDAAAAVFLPALLTNLREFHRAVITPLLNRPGTGAAARLPALAPALDMLYVCCVTAARLGLREHLMPQAERVSLPLAVKMRGHAQFLLAHTRAVIWHLSWARQYDADAMAPLTAWLAKHVLGSGSANNNAVCSDPGTWDLLCQHVPLLSQVLPEDAVSRLALLLLDRVLDTSNAPLRASALHALTCADTYEQPALAAVFVSAWRTRVSDAVCALSPGAAVRKLVNASTGDKLAKAAVSALGCLNNAKPLAETSDAAGLRALLGLVSVHTVAFFTHASEHASHVVALLLLGDSLLGGAADLRAAALDVASRQHGVWRDAMSSAVLITRGQVDLLAALARHCILHEQQHLDELMHKATAASPQLFHCVVDGAVNALLHLEAEQRREFIASKQQPKPVRVPKPVAIACRRLNDSVAALITSSADQPVPAPAMASVATVMQYVRLLTGEFVDASSAPAMAVSAWSDHADVLMAALAASVADEDATGAVAEQTAACDALIDALCASVRLEHVFGPATSTDVLHGLLRALLAAPTPRRVRAFGRACGDMMREQVAHALRFLCKRVAEPAHRHAALALLAVAAQSMRGAGRGRVMSRKAAKVLTSVAQAVAACCADPASMPERDILAVQDALAVAARLLASEHVALDEHTVAATMHLVHPLMLHPVRHVRTATAVYRVVHSAFRHRAKAAVKAIAPFLQALRWLFAGTVATAPSSEAIAVAVDVARLFQQLSLHHRAAVKKYAPYLIADVVAAIRADSLAQELRQVMQSGLHALIDTLGPHENEQLFRVLDQTGRAVYQSLYNEYREISKFSGKV